jgi:uncharacterized protein (DUF2147 family)
MMSLPRTSVFIVKFLFLAFAAPLGLFLSALAQATVSLAPAQASPVGRWQTVDDATGKAKSIVQIREENGKFYGAIETLFDPPVPHPTCYLCTGDLRDRPLVGLQVLSGFVQIGSQWSGGQVLDPESGKIYRASLTIEDAGKKLRLHGYIGIPLLGRTEHWQRAQ